MSFIKLTKMYMDKYQSKLRVHVSISIYAYIEKLKISWLVFGIKNSIKFFIIPILFVFFNMCRMAGHFRGPLFRTIFRAPFSGLYPPDPNGGEWGPGLKVHATCTLSFHNWSMPCSTHDEFRNKFIITVRRQSQSSFSELGYISQLFLWQQQAWMSC